MSGFHAAGVINVAWCMYLFASAATCINESLFACLSCLVVCVHFWCLLKHVCVFRPVCLYTYVDAIDTFQVSGETNVCLEWKAAAGPNEVWTSVCVYVCKKGKVCVYMLLCAFFWGGGRRVYFVWVSPVRAVTYRAVGAAVLCVSLLADDTVALLWVYCKAFITPAEPVDTEEQINWAFALCLRHILQPETCMFFKKQVHQRGSVIYDWSYGSLNISKHPCGFTQTRVSLMIRGHSQLTQKLDKI